MTDFKVNSVIICDDARQEVTGKEILIGVYNDVIIFPEFPMIMERLFVRINVTCDKAYAGPFQFGFGPESNMPTVSISGNCAAAVDDTPRIFGFTLRAVQFGTPGKYEIQFGLDAPPKGIWAIEARAPLSSEERERLARLT